MAARSSKTSSENTLPATTAAPAPDTTGLSVKSLAEAILARTVRPRAADVRRLAEAVLKKKQKKRKKADGKKRKLSKIPGQKSGK